MSLLPGSLTSERAKFWLSPTMTPSANAASTSFRVGAGGSGEGEGLNALVLAVAAVGIGIEVADECALDGGPGTGRAGHCVERAFGVVLWEGEDEFANAARLGETDGRSGGIAHTVNRGLAQLAEADDEEPLGGETRGGVQQEGFIRAGLVFAACKHGSGGCLNRRIGNEQRGLGFGVGTFGGLGVGGQDGQQLGLDAGEGGKGKFSPHRVYSSWKAWFKAMGLIGAPAGSRGRYRPMRCLLALIGGAGLAVGFAAALGFALVPVLLALGHGQLAFHPSIAEVKPRGDERMPLDLRLGE